MNHSENSTVNNLLFTKKETGLAHNCWLTRFKGVGVVAVQKNTEDLLDVSKPNILTYEGKIIRGKLKRRELENIRNFLNDEPGRLQSIWHSLSKKEQNSIITL